MTMKISSLSDDEVRILWAALLAMVHEIHCAQDRLTEEMWFKAEKIWIELDDEMNTRSKQ